MTIELRPTILISLENIVAKASGEEVSAINGINRRRAPTEARHLIWYIAREKYNFSLSHIGRIYERDHTTVYAAIKKLKNDPATELLVKKLFKKYKLSLKPALSSTMKTTGTWAL